MTNSTTPTKPFMQDAAKVADTAADSASSAIRSTQSAANAALDKLSEKVEDVRSQASPAITKLTGQAEAAARRGVEVVKDTSAQLRDKAVTASDATVGYIKDEPVKAMLIAAATGAALMALMSMMSRSDSNS